MATTTVATWLEALGLGQHADSFAENDIDWDILPDLTDADLKDLGVTSIGQRKKILKAISQLDEDPSPDAVAEAEADPAPETAAQDTGAPPTEQDAELRQVSVLFCDMVGSTALAAQLGPEDVREVQRLYQDTVATIATEHGGHVAQYLGDGLVIYFGWPIASENQALQAVRAGQAAVEAVAGLRVPGADLRLAARAGIATGRVIIGDLVGAISRQSAAISGDAPNLAARLEGLAEAGQLVIDDLTRRLLRSAFKLDDLGLHDMKGFEEKVQAFRVGPETGFELLAGSEDTGSQDVELVGRRGDDELIWDRWGQTLGGDGQAVLLTGEAGIGKSRMIRQLRHRMGEDGHHSIRFQCAQNLGNAALHPVVSALEKRADIQREDSTAERLDKMEAVLAPTTRPAEQRNALIGGMLKLPIEDRYPALGMSPQRLLEETLGAVIEEIFASAGSQPMLIVFEDLHWADPTTLELIGRLISEIGARKIMLLATYRMEFKPPWAGYAHLTQLTLNRLSKSACSDMIDQFTGGKPLDAAIKAEIIDKADGVPLFVEEITKTVLEAGYVIETETGFEPVSDKIDLGIPATIQDALTARLDRFSPVKSVAQIGACIGRDFSYDMLNSIAGMQDPALPTALEQLVKAEIVFSRGTPPLSTYLFKHALLRDAAYDSLLRKRKQHYHGQILKYLEAQEPVDKVRAAIHASAAGEPAKAVSYFLQAGQASMGAGTFGEAISQLRLGLAEVPKLADGAERDRAELDLRVALGTAEMAVKGWAADEIVEVLDPAVALAKKLGDDFSLGLSLFSIWIYHATRADLTTSQTWLEEMDAVALGNNSLELQMIADTAASMNYFWIGAFDKAERRRHRVLKDYDVEAHGHLVHYMNHDPFATVLQWGGATQLWIQGYPDQAVAAVDRALAHARTLQSPFAVVFALTIGSAALPFAGLGERMLEQCAEAAAICDEIGLPFIKIVSADSHRGRALLALDQLEDGVEVVTQSTAMWEAVGGRTTYAEYTSRTANALGKLGRFEEALALNQKALDHQAATGEAWFEPETYRIQAKLLLSGPEPDHAAALAYLDKACDLARRQGAKSFELRATMTLAEHLLAQGDAATARDRLAEIYAKFDEGFDTPDLLAAKALLERLAQTQSEKTA